MHSPSEASAAYFWSKIRQAIDAEDYAGIALWSLTAGVNHGAPVADLIRARVVQYMGDRRTTEQLIADVANAREDGPDA